MMKKQIALLLITVCLSSISATAQQILTLDAARAKAVESNRGLKIANEKVLEAEAMQRAALCQFFPKVSASGVYLWTEKDIHLLSDEQVDRVNNMGTTMQGNEFDRIGNWMQETFGLTDQQIASLRDRIGFTGAAQDINAIGQDITSALNLQTGNVYLGMVCATQPIYMGGKLRALYQAAQTTRELTQLNYDKAVATQLIAVDEAYWRVISLQHKKQLAEQYCQLLNKLKDDVESMQEVEVSTAADVAQVRVKLNEAEMNLANATNGLELSRMALNQICGLPLKETFILADDTLLVNYQPLTAINIDQVLNDRKEIRMLEMSKQIADAGVKGAASMLLPNVGITGGYLVSNPNLENGFSNTFGGMWTAGLAVNIPLCHPASFYGLKAAKHKRQEVIYQIEEAKEKIELQVNKLNYALEVANKKMQQAQSNLYYAEENLQLADESFKAGLISSSDLMQAQTAWLKAQNDVVEATIEIRMTHLYLQEALGR